MLSIPLLRRFALSTFAFLLLTHLSFAQSHTLTSPNGNQRLTVAFTADGTLQFSHSYKGKPVLQPSALGFRLAEPAMEVTRFKQFDFDTVTRNTTWQPVWGEWSNIVDHHKELKLTVADTRNPGVHLRIIFRAYNEGIALRYLFLQGGALTHFVIADELTQFRLPADHTAFWIPGDYDSNEFSYSTTKVSAIRRAPGADEIHAQTPTPVPAAQTPLMLKSADGLYINIHEAALVNYPAMNLAIDAATHTLTAHLVPDAKGNKAYLQAPAQTPWRTLIVSDDPTEVLASTRMILNLNEPSQIKDPSFIQPQKYVGIWWEMHVGKGSWDLKGEQVGSNTSAKVPHAANTANTKKYLDFAAKHGFKGVLVEGWNSGWEDWFGKWEEDVFDFVTPYRDFDVEELQRYAASKGVKLIMHHETSGSVTNYERWQDSAYRFMKRYGYDAVKTGYVGRIIPRGEHHDGQWMVNHFNRTIRKTAAYRINLDAHEPVRPTGLHRTWPNFLACEAGRGQEFNAWSSGNPPEHETILPFTRIMGGPMDYTPGIFQIKLNVYDSAKKEQVHTTLAKQLALYVTLYSPLQMAADLPENYEKHLDAFQFIKDVPVDWSDTRYLAAEPGDHLTVARKAKGGESWYVGSITDENARTQRLPLTFLTPGRKYLATLYADAPDAHWERNPMAYRIERYLVDAGTVVNLRLAASGGTAISIVPADGLEVRGVKKYPKK